MPALTAAEELEALRTSNSDLIKKAHDRKARVIEHETTIATLQRQLQTATSALHDATVATPLRVLAHDLSPIPSVFLSEFAKHYKAEMVNGKLVLLTLDGKPAMDGDKEIPFEAEAIRKLLTAGTNEDYKAFPHLIYGSRANGGGASPSPGSQVQYPEKQIGKEPDRPQFGLR